LADQVLMALYSEFGTPGGLEEEEQLNASKELVPETKGGGQIYTHERFRRDS
jgi:hypothetical protein